MPPLVSQTFDSTLNISFVTTLFGMDDACTTCRNRALIIEMK